MATIQVPPGKGGVIVLGGQHCYLNHFDLAIDVDNELYKHFEQTPDAIQLVWAQCLTGHATGEANIKGNFDQTPGAMLPAHNVWPSQANTGFLGYTSSIGFNVSFTIIGVRTSQDAGQPASSVFEAKLKITACSLTGMS